MSQESADVVICGAGIAGITAAYHLAAKHGLDDVLLVDERPPLSLTSDKSTEGYRNWWPGPDGAMVGLIDHSIDLMEELAHETGNSFHLNRRGYLYVTGDPDYISEMTRTTEEMAGLGAGPVRYHTGRPGEPEYSPPPASGFEDQPTGVDIILDRTLIRRHYPYISERAVAALHVRRAGWFSGQQFGMTMLEQARKRGARLTSARLAEVQLKGDKIQSVRLSGDGSETTISTPNFVIAAGPFLRQVGHMIGVDLPVFSECHIKASFNDHLGVVPREAPLIIWSDPQRLPWSDEERAALAESEETRWLLEQLPASAHTRPEGGPGSTALLMLWAYHADPVEPVFPISFDPLYPEVVLRGLATMIPGLRAYFDRLPKPVIDGGYYTKTRENRPLIGPLLVEGAYVIGALSGFGLMAAAAAGELLAAHLMGNELPSYAPAFALERYKDPAYQKLLGDWGALGQL